MIEYPRQLKGRDVVMFPNGAVLTVTPGQVPIRGIFLRANGAKSDLYVSVDDDRWLEAELIKKAE